MALYRIYVDEVGNHDLTHADDPNQLREKRPCGRYPDGLRPSTSTKWIIYIIH